MPQPSKSTTSYKNSTTSRRRSNSVSDSGNDFQACNSFTVSAAGHDQFALGEQANKMVKWAENINEMLVQMRDEGGTFTRAEQQQLNEQVAALTQQETTLPYPSPPVPAPAYNGLPEDCMSVVVSYISGFSALCTLRVFRKGLRFMQRLGSLSC